MAASKRPSSVRRSSLTLPTPDDVAAIAGTSPAPKGKSGKQGEVPANPTAPITPPQTSDPQASPAPSDDEASTAAATPPQSTAKPAKRVQRKLPDGPLPVRLLGDRLLVMLDTESAERRSAGGILIPATATVGKRLAWAYVVGTGMHVRQVAMGDRVMFDPEDRAEVEIGGQGYLLLRERDVAGVAEGAGADIGTGMYL